jgi:signal transduction histidine kinase
VNESSTTESLRRAAVVCGFLGTAFGAVALVGGVARLPLLASLGRGFAAMLPASATALGLMGSSLVLLASTGVRRAALRWAALLVVPVGLWSYLYLLSYFSGLYVTPEKHLAPPIESVAGEAPPQESPISAACFFLMTVAIYCLGTRRARGGVELPEDGNGAFFPGGFAAASGTVAALANLIGALGYAYGAPQLFGGMIAPTALPTALGMLALSVGLILVAGPNHWPLRPLMGTSAAAVLLRNFLPVTAAATLIGGALHIQLLKHAEIHPVLVSALWALAFTVIVSFLVSGIAHEIGNNLDAAEQRIEGLNKDLAHRLAELGETNHRLVQQSEENEMFVYSVSHDLRSPLVNLQGFSKELSLVCEDIRTILNDAALPADARKRGLDLVDSEMGQSIRFIQTAVMRLANIIDSLLRLSRAGRVELHCSQVDLNVTVGRVVEALHGTVTERRAKVAVQPLPFVWGDPTVLEQIFGNLIGNALNYLDPARPGLVEVGARTPAEENGHAAHGLLTCYVRDNGLGIPQAYHQKVFQAFQRFHADKAKGEGMGLASVRRLVDRHGGRIWFESTSGEGTTFFVSLPIRPAANGLPPLAQGDKGPAISAKGSNGHDYREIYHSHGGRR